VCAYYGDKERQKSSYKTLAVYKTVGEREREREREREGEREYKERRCMCECVYE
jgi:hypothetical protein